MDLGKLVQEQMSKYSTSATPAQSINEEVDYGKVGEKMGEMYRKGKKAVDEQISDAKDKFGKAKAGFEKGADDPDSFKNRMKRNASEVVDKVKKGAGEAYDATKKHVGDAVDTVKKAAADHPKTAAGLAAGAGLIGSGVATYKYMQRKKQQGK